MIAALYVATGGCYWNLPDVDPWDEQRDARLYAGPHPVVAHPPCQRWGKLWAGQPLFIKQTGIRKIKGDDGGCFKAALAAVRTYGGVLEHPAYSHAWVHFGLNRPPRAGGWIAADFHGGWTCCVDLPDLDFGIGPSRLDPAVIERMGLERAKRLGEVGSRGGGTDSAPRIGTPIPFRDLLISIAQTAHSQRAAA